MATAARHTGQSSVRRATGRRSPARRKIQTTAPSVILHRERVIDSESDGSGVVVSLTKCEHQPENPLWLVIEGAAVVSPALSSRHRSAYAGVGFDIPAGGNTAVLRDLAARLVAIADAAEETGMLGGVDASQAGAK
jgi:hypothetical protein